jgi:hypothetical protein
LATDDDVLVGEAGNVLVNEKLCYTLMDPPDDKSVFRSTVLVLGLADELCKTCEHHVFFSDGRQNTLAGRVVGLARSSTLVLDLEAGVVGCHLSAIAQIYPRSA